jgi:hypothetical protein
MPALAGPPLQGTGIVTSVPSDAPDDYAALMDLGGFLLPEIGNAGIHGCVYVNSWQGRSSHPLQFKRVEKLSLARARAVNKPKLREKYGIQDDWVLPYKVRFMRLQVSPQASWSSWSGLHITVNNKLSRWLACCLGVR